MAKVSIIIPVYNVEKYLDKCVQSARHQTLQDIEIILVDDESPDGCPLLCDEYAKQDSRIKVVHKKNGGLGFARNSGLEVATGEYVTFLDSDDFVDNFTYEHLYNLSKLHNLDALYYNFIRFSDENKVTTQCLVNEIIEYKGGAVKDLMLDIIGSEPTAKVERKVQCSSCTAMYRMDIIKQNNVRFHSERELISEDMIFNLDFLMYSQKVALNQGEHYHYRVNPTSLTSSIRTDRIEKNYMFYIYILENISNWGLNKQKGYDRGHRLFIGYSRMDICQYINSPKSLNKNQWLKEQVKYPVWKNIYETYNWEALPLFQRTFFYACVKKHLVVIKLLCKLKSIIK